MMVVKSLLSLLLFAEISIKGGHLNKFYVFKRATDGISKAPRMVDSGD